MTFYNAVFPLISERLIDWLCHIYAKTPRTIKEKIIEANDMLEDKLYGIYDSNSIS